MRILLGKSDLRTARFLGRALREDAYAVDLVAHGEALLAECQGVNYAAIVLHSELAPRAGADVPARSGGMEMVRQLRARHIQTPILLLQAPESLTRSGPDSPRTAGGALAVLQEPFTLAELRMRLRRLIRLGSGAPPASSTAWSGLMLDPHRRCARRNEMEVHLTRKEYALLELLLLRAPRAVTHAEIIAHVWDGSFEGDSNLIEVYIARLRRRLDRLAGRKLLHTVRGIGYRAGKAEA